MVVRAVVFFCLILLSPTASAFGSGVSCAARTFLSCYHQRQTETLLSVGKGTKKNPYTYAPRRIFFDLYG